MEQRLKAIPRLIAALLKHRVKQLLGEEATSIIAQEIITFGHDEVNRQIEGYFAARLNHQALQDAVARTEGHFKRSFSQPPELAGYFLSQAWAGEPNVETAILEFAVNPESALIETALHSALDQVNWTANVTDDDKSRAVRAYMDALWRALLPLESHASQVIGLHVLETHQTVQGIDVKADVIQQQIADLHRLIAQELAGREHQLTQRQIADYDPLPLPFPDDDNLPDVGHLPPGSRLDMARNEVFTGRETELKQLAEILLHGDGQKAACISTGYGGIGKTQLAIEFAYRFGRYFRGVHWLSARSGRLEDDIAVCGRQMGIDHQELAQQVNETVQKWQNSSPRLILIDNAENPAVLEHWWAQFSNLRVLITSRRTQWARSLGLTQLELTVLSKEQARDLLRKLAPRLENVDDGELDAIGDKLGYLPLALDLVGRYLDENRDMSPSAYLRAVEGHVLDHEALKDWFDDTDFMATDQQRNVIACFDLSWEQLGREKGQTNVNSLARKVLRGCGYCAPNEPIPVELLEMAFEDRDDDHAPSVRAALRRLLEVGLLRQTQEGEVGPTIHPLMAEYARLKDESDDERVLGGIANRLKRLANAAFDTGLPQAFQDIQAHMQPMAELGLKVELKDAGWLLRRLGSYHGMIGDFNGARLYCEQSVAFFETILEADDPDLATALNDLAIVLHNLGEFTDAKSTFEQVIEIYEQAYPAVDEHVAAAVNNLGTVLKDLGDLDGAKSAFERALQIWEAVFGDNHPQVAIGHNNLGGVLKDLGDLQAAKNSYERALSIDEAVFGKDHPNVARDINNLGNVLKALGNLHAAKSALERALRIDEAVFGKNHPEVATSVNNLGLVLQDLGDLEGAKSAYVRALSIDEAVFGADHPKIAIRVNNLGLVLQDLGDLEGAKSAFERALKIDEAVFGTEHPNVAIDVNNLGGVLRAMGDLDGAKSAFERALGIWQAVFGDDHPQVAIGHNNLGHLSLAMDDLQQARAYFERALQIRLKFFQDGHPSLENSRRSLDYVKRQLSE